MIDLRSDTMTLPSDAMRAAMADAKVGDDVWNEDPTVIALQDRVAALVAKEAALFVPSGSMANQISLWAHCDRGDEVVVGWGVHCTNYEAGGGAALAGVQFKEVGTAGFYTAQDLLDAVRPFDIHNPISRLAWLENTHNRGGGKIFPQHHVVAIAAAAYDVGIAVHLDGARLLNAAIASKTPVSELAAPATSLSICLSKGLGAPAGSVLAGPRPFIEKAKRLRKMFGGGMRQIGILAAAGLYALDNNIERMAEDHDHAQILARGFADIDGLDFDASSGETNMVFFDLPQSELTVDRFLSRCKDQGLQLCPFGGRRIRAVTHLDISASDCERALEIVRTAIKG